jgi:predicted dehydrogenase
MAMARERRKVKVGVIGLRFGSAFARIFSEHPDSELVAIADLEPEARNALAPVVPARRVYTAFEEVIGDREIEAVGVFTPAPLHANHACAALEAGKHVLCAVPAALTLEDCRRLIESADRSGRTYMMAETSCYYPEILHLQSLARSQAMGEIFYCESDYFHDSEQDPTTWQGPQHRGGWREGFPPFFYITHNSSAIITVTGQRMTAAAALGWGPKDDALFPNNPYRNPFTLGVGLFRLSGGGIARIGLCWRVAHPGYVRFKFFGTKRCFESGDFAWEQDVMTSRETGAQKMELTPPVELLPAGLGRHTGHKGSHPFIVHEFLRAIIEQRPAAVDARTAVAFTAPGICAHESCLRNGEWVEIPAFE